MRPLARFLPFLLILAAAPLPAASPFSPEDDARASALLAQMTRAEKIGQLQQMNVRRLTPEVREALRAGGVGSALNAIEPKQIREMQRIAMEESRLGIPLLLGRDVIHGFRTVLPIPLGLAATWNPEVIEEGAALSAREARGVGLNWTFAPMIDVTRDPRWGRVAESPGEDPFLASVYATAMVRGLQGDDLRAPDRLAATAKHFAAYGASQAGRDYNTTWVPEQQLWEVHLPPFKAAVDAGVASFMSGFNDLNGVPATANAWLFQDVLRETWGFDGMVVSDWDSIEELIEHGIAADEREAALLAARAGIDLEMVSTTYADHYAELLEEGLLSEEQLDAKVRHILRLKSALGLFENPYPPEGAVYPPPVTDEARATAQRAALESAVLLKNEDRTLPLTGEAPHVLVMGPLADQPYEQYGTWAFDGREEDSVTPRTAFETWAAETGATVEFIPGLTYSRDQTVEDREAVLAAAREADALVFFAGEESILSGEARSRTDITLPGAQAALIAALAETGTPLTVVVMAGRPLVLENILPHADALLYSFHPGTMGGPALVDLLVGRASPSGKLPITIPRSVGQIPIFYSHRNTGRPKDPAEYVFIDDIPVGQTQTSLGFDSHYLDESNEPRFVFGEGLSYTTFTYRDGRLSAERAAVGTAIEVSIEVENTGERAGAEVVQLYLRDHKGSLSRPVRELKGFEKIHLAPGETSTVSFTLTPELLSFPGPDGSPRLEPGLFEVFVGGSSQAPSRGTFVLE
ncbi:MAG: beta-glucosidase BglX [Opitutales bacterium]